MSTPNGLQVPLLETFQHEVHYVDNGGACVAPVVGTAERVVHSASESVVPETAAPDRRNGTNAAEKSSKTNVYDECVQTLVASPDPENDDDYIYISPEDVDDTIAVEMKPRKETDQFEEQRLSPFEKLTKLEEKACAPRWASLDWFPHRLLHLATTFRWMRGHGDPSKDVGTIRRAYFKEEFLEGFMHIAGRAIKIGILLLVIVQIANATRLLDILDLLVGGDRQALTIALYGAAKSKAFRNSLVSLFALPFVWGLARGIIACCRVELQDGELNPRVQAAVLCLQEEAIAQKRRNVWKHIWYDGLRWLLPLHPVNRSILVISRALRWDARLDPLQRQKAQAALISLFESGQGYTKFIAGYEIVRILDSTHQVRLVNDEYVLLGDGLSSPMMPSNENQAEDAGEMKEPSSSPGSPVVMVASQTHLFNLVLKERAVIDIMNFAVWPAKKWESSSFYAKPPLLIGYIYGRYLQWWIGLAPTTKESAAFWTFKLAKLAYSLLLIRTVYLALNDYINCPEKPGITYTGVAPWAGKFDATCLEATIKEFNRFPGQDAATLTRLLPNYYIPDEKKKNFTLDVRGKDLTGSTIAGLIDGFVDQGFVLTSINLANNRIGLHDYNDPSETIELARALSRLKQLRSLNISNNWVGFCSPDLERNIDCGKGNQVGTVALGQAFQSLERLESLDLSANWLGYVDEIATQGTEAIGTGLGALKNLRRLSLAHNYIGRHDDKNPNGTMAIGAGLSNLMQLSELDFSGNALGLGQDDRGIEAIGLGLASIRSLTSLDLSENHIGANDEYSPHGTIALSQGLATQTSLRMLNMSGNRIGAGDEFEVEGTVALATALSGLTHLTTLDLSKNYIGASDQWSSRGTEAIGQALGHLTSLTTLMMMQNCLGCGRQNAAGLFAFAQSIGSLSKLAVLHLSENHIGTGDGYNSSGTIALGEAIGKVTTLTSLNLNHNSIGIHDNLDHAGTVALALGIANCQQLTFVDLSHNAIAMHDNENSLGTEELGKALAKLRQLRTLDLSHNFIGSGDGVNPLGTQALAKGLGARAQLRHLNLGGNELGRYVKDNPQGAVAIARGLSRMRSLVSLDLSNTWLGYDVDESSPSIIELDRALGSLTRLRDLSLFPNAALTCKMVTRFQSTLSKMPNRISIPSVLGSSEDIDEYFDLIPQTQSVFVFSNSFFNRIQMSPNSTSLLEHFFQRLAQFDVRHLDLSNNGFGFFEEDQIAAIAEGLSNLTGLVALDLSWNDLGTYSKLDLTDISGRIAFGKALGQLKNLQLLNLTSNGMGLHPDILAALVQHLAPPKLTVLDLSFNAIGEREGDNRIGSVMLSRALRRMPNLQYLDLTDNDISHCDRNACPLVEGIGSLGQLRVLNLSRNSIGSNDAGTIVLGNALGQLTQLRQLNIARNRIGDYSEAGELAVVTGITKLRNLCLLDVGENSIGKTNSLGPRLLLDFLPTVTIFNIDKIQNISWTDSAQKMSQITSEALRAKCENQVCFGARITSQELKCDAQVSFPVASPHESAAGLGFATLPQGGGGGWVRHALYDVDISEFSTQDSGQTLVGAASAHNVEDMDDVFMDPRHHIRSYIALFTVFPLILLIVLMITWKAVRTVCINRASR